MYCTLGTQACCYNRDTDLGACVATMATCITQRLDCDDTADCPGAVCCARYNAVNGNLQDSTCEIGTACPTTGGDFEMWCNPAAPSPCPGSLACTGSSTTPGYHVCQ